MTDTIEVLAQQIEALRRGMFKQSVNSQLAYSAIDDGYLSLVNDGQLSGLVGTIFDGTTGAFSVAGPNPPRPAAPALMQCIGGITVIWSGLWVDPQPGFTSPVVAPMDFSYVEVTVSDHSDFSLNVMTKQIVSARGGAVDFVWTRINTPLYARLRAVSASGKFSSYSTIIGPLASGGMDVTIPQAPTGLTLTTLATFSSTGDHMASITASWTGVASNTDGSAFDDFSHYDVQWWWTSLPSTAAQMVSTTTTTATWTVGPGLAYNVQVRAVDVTGHVSAWTSISSVVAAVDTTAPNAPSAPVVSNYLGQLRIFWDGKDSTGVAMPIDFSVVEVHVSAVSGFTPSSATLVSQISNAVYAYATAPYGATRYVKFIAVDSSLNRSLPSAQSSGATTQVADGDISSLSIGKLTAGTISVDVVIGGRFTTALTGARVEMNSLGFQKFDTDGVSKLVSITGTEALLTGVYKTATSGRRIEIGSSGSTGEIDFLAPDGTLGQITSFTAATGAVGVEAIRFGIPNTGLAAGSYWNSTMVQSNEIAITTSRIVKSVFGGNTQSFSPEFSVAYTPTSTVNSSGGFDGSVTRFRITGGSSGSTAFFGPDGSFRLIIDDTQLLSGVPNFQTSGYSDPYSRIEINPNGGYSTNSPGIKFVTPGNFGAGLWYYQGGQIEARSYDLSAGQAFGATAFNITSDAKTKDEIALYDGDPLAMLRPTKLRTFVRKPPAAAATKVPYRPDPSTPPSKREVGVIAQEMHPDLQAPMSDGLGVSLSAWLAVVHAAVLQVADRLDTLEKGVRG